MTHLFPHNPHPTLGPVTTAAKSCFHILYNIWFVYINEVLCRDWLFALDLQTLLWEKESSFRASE